MVLYILHTVCCAYTLHTNIQMYNFTTKSINYSWSIYQQTWACNWGWGVGGAVDERYVTLGGGVPSNVTKHYKGVGG